MGRIFFSCFLACCLSSCGGVQKYQAGIDERATLIVRSEILIGHTVEVGQAFNLLVSKADLSPYQLGVLGAKDSVNEGLQAIVLEVESGSQLIKISIGSTPVYEKTLYFSAGQTREIRIRQ